MKQAATLNEQQLRRVVDYCKRTKNPLRNRTILLITHWSGMRVGEVAALRWCDVIASDGSIKSEIRLSADQTKGRKARVVLVPERLRLELRTYCAHQRAPADMKSPLFATQRAAGFSANSLTHIINSLYRGAGLDGATSHSGRRTFITNLAERGVSARVLLRAEFGPGVRVEF